MTGEPAAIRFTDDLMIVTLAEGREVEAPLAGFPRLLWATAEQREAYELSATGIHWDGLNEDVSIQGLLDGVTDQVNPGITAAAFDRMFDAGEDVLPYMATSKVYRPNQDTVSVTIDLPRWVIHAIEANAAENGESSQSLIKRWLMERAIAGNTKPQT